MVTFVSKVFVSNGNNSALATAPASIKKGQFIVYDVDAAKYTIDADTKRFKIGMGSGKSVKDHKGVSHPEIKWSNIIQADDIRSINVLAYKADTEEAVKIDFTKINAAVLKLLAVGGKRIIVRLTFKDLPTRFRKWTESYEYVTLPGDTAATISKNIADLINKQWKRARVVATDAAGVITLTAMPYDDDDSVDTLNVANKVRFNANVYYTDPAAEGWESLNKHYPTGVTIEKTPGTQYAASAKLVRDREAWSMGYDGILNRGEGTWPIIKPAMETKLDGQYNAINIEFENAYRAADDIVRKTKQNVEIYTTGATNIITDLIAKIGTPEAASVTTHNNGD
ncbi:hypothetical protein [uncultured phage cr272_1]|uniref:Uncharacterized protein n=1 Tax=uncultured phage cr272_1 TaxID=2772094 RepID=A0A7M1RTP8_9CAUD|nr:hypothetical protein KNV61_gp34 [uncultured phage cr272_1]QOR57825.1 hypothetical protein [uncultured phage cr272_1]